MKKTKTLTNVLKWISACVLLVPLLAEAGKETEIPLSEVPEGIMEAARRIEPKADFHRAQIETEDDGTKVYEIQGRLKDGRRIEVDVLENGHIQEYELEFTEAQVPGAVLKGIQKKLPGFKPTYIEASHSATGKVMQYEFEGTLGDQNIDIEVSADGRKIVVADK